MVRYATPAGRLRRQPLWRLRPGFRRADAVERLAAGEAGRLARAAGLIAAARLPACEAWRWSVRGGTDHEGWRRRSSGWQAGQDRPRVGGSSPANGFAIWQRGGSPPCPANILQKARRPRPQPRRSRRCDFRKLSRSTGVEGPWRHVTAPGRVSPHPKSKRNQGTGAGNEHRD